MYGQLYPTKQIPWWCGYPGCKITGECAYINPGPCWEPIVSEPAKKIGGEMNFVWEQIEVDHGEPSEMIVIIARTLRYVEAWCRIHKINPMSPRVRFVSNVMVLQGISHAYYVDLGTSNQELRTLLERLKNIKALEPLLTPNSQA